MLWTVGNGRELIKDVVYSRYYSFDDPHDDEQSQSTTHCHLEQAMVNFCMIFQVRLSIF